MSVGCRHGLHPQDSEPSGGAKQASLSVRSEEKLVKVDPSVKKKTHKVEYERLPGELGP